MNIDSNEMSPTLCYKLRYACLRSLLILLVVKRVGITGEFGKGGNGKQHNLALILGLVKLRVG
jgi:hypothetical protein